MATERRLRFLRRRGGDGDAWHAVELARHQDRPYTLDYLNRICDDFVELHGDRAESDDPAIVAGLGLVPRARRWPSSAIRRAAT